jgi:hypothetical protein
MLAADALSHHTPACRLFTEVDQSTAGVADQLRLGT